MAGAAPFFMDYRNADGSIAEMCGNGVRVFLRYLQSSRAGRRRDGGGDPRRGPPGLVRADG